MAKDKLTDYDSAASGNLDVGGISVAEGMLPSGVNNAIRELMSHQADAFGAGTPLYVDQTNNRLGINQASPAHPLHVGTDDLIVDASGNLLVGKTSDDNTTVGGAIRNTGVAAFVADGNHPLIINRKTSDGDLISLRKDGTTVGSIGTNGGYLYIGSPVGNDAYVWMGADAIAPSTSSGGNRDNAISLGTSGNRFKDLWLSGGVYLGGTGSANHLDDYEEGVWTPVLAGATTTTYTSQIGKYTKIGELVYLFFDIQINSLGNGQQTTVVGLPFPPYNNDALAVSYWTGLAVSPYFVGFQIGTGPQALAVGTTAAGSVISNGMAIFQNGSRIIASGCYRTPS